MAVNVDDIDLIAARTVDVYREAEVQILAIVRDHLARSIDAPTWAEDRLAAITTLRRAAEKVVKRLQDGGKRIRAAVAAGYRNGYGGAIFDLPKSAGGDAAKAARKEVPRVEALDSLASALIRDVGERERNVLRHVDDIYREVIAAAVARSVGGGITRRDASQAAWQGFVDQGVTSFTDRSGRTWRLTSYVEMAVRTVTMRAAVQGQLDRLTSLGVDLVVVDDEAQECVRCRPWEGKILRIGPGPVGDVEVESAITDDMITVHIAGTVESAMLAGLLHPNCRHRLRAYQPGATRLPKGETSDPEGDKARQRQRQRYVERQIRRHKERELGALTPEAKRKAKAQIRAWQAEMRTHLAANPTLKRLPYREEIGAGNLPPGGTAPSPAGRLTGPPPPPADGLDTMEDNELRSLATEFEITGARDMSSADLINRLRKLGAVSPDRAQEMAAAEAADLAARQAALATQRRIDGITRYQPDLAGLEDLAADVRLAVTEGQREHLSGGQVGEVARIVLPNGHTLFTKTSGDWFERSGQVVTDAEQLGSLLGRAIAAPVPRLIRTGETEIWTDWAEGQIGETWFTNRLIAGLDGEPDNDFLRGVVNSQAGLRLGLFDLLTNNHDRHAANWMVTADGRLNGIDHGLAWWDAGMALDLTDPAAFAQVVRAELIGPFVRPWFNQERLEDDGTAVPIDTDAWTRADVAETRRRLTQLRPEFKRVGQPQWLDYALRVLDLLEPFAKGLRSIFDD